MRVLVTGAGGMLGQDLPPTLSPRHEVLALRREQCDITSESTLQQIASEWKPQLIINCAAQSDVDECERDPTSAAAVNAEGAGNVARVAARAGARLFHISTDYIFDGHKSTPYSEADQPNPINQYGVTKLEGERQVREAPGDPGHRLIIRTSWRYGMGRFNFVEKTLGEAHTLGRVEAIADQVSCPTWTLQLAQRIAQLIDIPASGVLHIAGGTACSRYEMACYLAGTVGPSVQATALRWEQLNRPGRRPSYSALRSTRLEQFGLKPLPDWRSAVDEYLRMRATRSSVPEQPCIAR